jgi:hypothetical protein
VTVTLDDKTAALLGRVIACLRREKISYALIGAWALAAWGRPRATLDVDFLVLIKEEGLEHLSAQMARAGLKLDETWVEWNPMLRGVQLRFQWQEVMIDLLRPRDQHDQQVFQRKRKKRFDGRYYWVVSMEDFILQKLKVGRPRDFEDAMSVVERHQKGLDHAYLEHWAKQLGVMEELDYLLSL